jgi:hypothetical protein
MIVKRLVLVLSVTALGLGLEGTARAQFTYRRPATSPFYQPAVSPYLNLTLGGVSPGVSYQSLVLPQIDTYNTIQGLQSDLIGLQRQGLGTNGGSQANVLVTGHIPRFFYYGTYYTFPSPKYGPLSGGGQSSQRSGLNSPISRPSTPSFGLFLGGGNNNNNNNNR